MHNVFSFDCVPGHLATSKFLSRTNMARFTFAGLKISLLIFGLLIIRIGMTGASQDQAEDPDGISPWRRAIAAKLCGSNGHNDEIAQQYFDCYHEDITPGGSKFVECQEHVYKVQMNSETSLDKACMFPDKLPVYEDCIWRSLIAAGVNPSESIEKLDECQGTAVSVPDPSGKKTKTVSASEED